MRIGVLGINYKSSDLNLRERIAKAALLCFGSNSDDHQIPLVLLSTCNRTEMYFSGENLASIHGYLLHLLREKVNFSFEHHMYCYFELDCFEHLACVTAGLDSAIVFETDIQRQVKIAYENASLHQHLPKELHYLFQKSLKIGKAIRSSFSRAEIHETLEKMIFHLARNYFRDFENVNVLFVGNSEINRKIFSGFFANQMKNISLCTRSKGSIEGDLQKWPIEVFGWEKLEEWIHYDLVICGSNTQDYLIRGNEKLKKNQLILDLAVPRNVDPHIGRHPNIQLLNIDELSNLMRQDRHRQKQEIKQCLELIREKARCQLDLFLKKQKTIFTPLNEVVANNPT